jgi:hypothetical protein
VAGRAALDRAAEQQHARAEDDLALGVALEQLDEARQLVERRRQVRVPVARVARRAGEGREHALADGLGLAAVRLLVDDREALRRARGERAQELERAVRAAVVDEHEVAVRARGGEGLERRGVEARGFIEEGDDDDRPRGPVPARAGRRVLQSADAPGASARRPLTRRARGGARSRGRARIPRGTRPSAARC